MNLNAQIIAAELGEHCVRAHFAGNRLSRKLRFPALYSGETRPEGDRIYIADSGSMPPDLDLKNIPAFICVGEPDDRYLGGGCDIIAVSEGSSIGGLLTLAAEVFDKYGAWERAMQDSIIRDEPIRRMGELSETIFENPIQLYDSNHKCIFSILNTGRYKIPEDYTVCEDNTYLSLEEINLLKITPEFIEAASKRTPMLHATSLYKYRAISKSIFFEGKYAARILVDEICREFSDRDFALIDILGDFILSVMQKNNSLSLGRPKHMDGMLTKMLSHKLVEEGVIDSVLAETGWGVYDRYFCITVEPTEYDRTGSSLNVLAARISSMASSECYLVFGEIIVFVFNLTVTNANRGDYLKIIVPVLRDSMLKAGISTTFSDFKNLYYYHRQCLMALELGKEKDGTYWFYRFDEYALDHITKSSRKGLIPQALWPDGLSRLHEHDRACGTDYVGILRIYLECNMNIAETTRRLYLHRNTLLYRLGRIKEILHLNLEDFNTRLLLMIVLRSDF